MKKILLITIHLPYPPNRGASVFNTFKLVEYLHQNHQLFLASLLKNDDHKYASGFVNYLSLKEYAFESVNISRSLMNLVKSYIKNVSLNVYRSYSSNLKDKIRAIASNYDIILVDHYEAFQYVPSHFKGKVIFRIHNAEYLIWKRYAKLQQNPIKKFIFYLESKRIKKLEKRYCEQADVVLGPINDNIHLEPDSKIREKKFINFTFLGDDTQLQFPTPTYSSLNNSLLYVGTLSWEPNIDGLVWFIQSCWESLVSRVHDIKLYIIGRNPDKRLTNIAKKYSNIIFTGFVEDLEEYFTICKVNIVPLRFGSGVKVKVINGLCRGIPIVTTPIGVESINVIHKKHIFIAQNETEFIDYTIELLKDENIWNHISCSARQIAQEKYTWKSIYKTLDKVL